MKKININIDYDWIAGYLRYGHREGILELTDEEYEEFKKNPKEFVEDTGLECDLNLKLVIDDYRVEDWGDFEVEYEEVEEENE